MGVWKYISIIFSTAFDDVGRAQIVVEVLVFFMAWLLPSYIIKPRPLLEKDNSVLKFIVWKLRANERWRAVFLISAWAFIHFAIIQPYRLADSLSKKINPTNSAVNWTPPKLNKDIPILTIIWGGAFEHEVEGTTVTVNRDRATNYDIAELRSRGSEIFHISGLPAIRVRIVEDRVFCDFNVPTARDPIRISKWSSTPLPERWDWNSDDTVVEIVDEELNCIFQAQFRTNNMLWLRGTIEYQGQIAAGNDLGFYGPSPRAAFKGGDVQVPQVFLYPSRENQSKRMKR